MLAYLFKAKECTFSIYVWSIKEKQLQLNASCLLVTAFNVDGNIKSLWNLSPKSRLRQISFYSKTNLAAIVEGTLDYPTLMKKIIGVANPEQNINYIASYQLSVLMEGTSDVNNQNIIYM